LYQLARHNLTPQQKLYLIGKRQRIEKKPHVGRPKNSATVALFNKTSKKIAAELRIGYRTVETAAQYSEAVDNLSGKIDKEKLDKGL